MANANPSRPGTAESDKEAPKAPKKGAAKNMPKSRSGRPARSVTKRGNVTITRY